MFNLLLFIVDALIWSKHFLVFECQCSAVQSVHRERQLVFLWCNFTATRVTHGMIGSSDGRATCLAKDAALTVNGGVITREDPAVLQINKPN